MHGRGYHGDTLPAPSGWRICALYRLAWLAWSVLLGNSVAVFVITALFGRVPLLQILQGRSSVLLLAAVVFAVSGWWLAYGLLLERRTTDLAVRSAVFPALPLMLGTAIPMLAVYLSDAANHYFYYSMVSPSQAGVLSLLLLLLMATLLLQIAELHRTSCGSYLPALRVALDSARQPFIFVILMSIGLLQSLSYLNLLGNDFLRYWTVADALSSGAGYAATLTSPLYVQGGMTQQIVDLPLFPVLLAASFTFLGHTVAAAYVPVLLANVALPPLMYLLVFEVVPSRVVALSLTSLVVLFPPMRFYVLNWPLPDSLFLTLLLASCWLLVKILKDDRGLAIWLEFGLLSAAVALARPEGVAYAAVNMVVAVSASTAWTRRSIALASMLLPVAVFSLVLMISLGTPWPRSLAGTMGLQNIAANWQMLSSTTLTFFASAIRVSASELVAFSGLLLLLGLVGSWPWLYRPRRVAVLMLPAWLNLLSVAMVDQRVSGVFLWYDFFRHISYPLPLILIAATLAVRSAFSSIGHAGIQRASLAALNLFLILGVLWNIHFLIKPNLTFGPDAGNLIGAERIDFVDIVTHPMELPRIQFELADGHAVPVTTGPFLSRYPDVVLEFYAPFDPIPISSAVAYQLGTLYLFLAALLLVAVPTRLRAGAESTVAPASAALRRQPEAAR